MLEPWHISRVFQFYVLSPFTTKWEGYCRTAVLLNTLIFSFPNPDERSTFLIEGLSALKRRNDWLSHYHYISLSRKSQTSKWRHKGVYHRPKLRHLCQTIDSQQVNGRSENRRELWCRTSQISEKWTVTGDARFAHRIIWQLNDETRIQNMETWS